MSKQNVEKMLSTELEALNNIIDMKIVKGFPYTKEAREHKYLLARLMQSKKRSKSSFLNVLSRFNSVSNIFL